MHPCSRLNYIFVLLVTGLNSTEVMQNFIGLKSRSKYVVLLDEISLTFN